MTSKRRGRQYCYLCVVVQLLVLFGFSVKYFSPKGDNFLVTLDWHQFHDQDKACSWLGEFGATVAYPDLPWNQALLLKGAASHWPATRLISVDWLVHNTTPSKKPGTCIVSPSPIFKVFNNNSELIDASKDPVRAPSLPARLELMTLKEFVHRQEHLQQPMFYPKGEFYYYQGPVPMELNKALQTSTRPLSCLNHTLAGMAVQQDAAQAEHADPPMLALTGALMRLTLGDTTHIAHYDSSATAMLQLSGLKDVWLIPPSQRNYTYPWERDTLLYRRAKVNLTHPDYEKFPLAKHLTPVKIRLHPGDFLIFPPFVPHQPEAVTDSISISFRMKTVYPTARFKQQDSQKQAGIHASQPELTVRKAALQAKKPAKVSVS